MFIDNASNTTPNWTTDFVFKGNSLAAPAPSDNGFDSPIWQMAQLYTRYYVYKSSITIRIIPLLPLLNVASTNPKIYGLYAVPTVDATPFDIADVNWQANSAGGTRPEKLQGVRFKYYGSNGSATKIVKVTNKMSTKRILNAKTSEWEDEYSGEITPGGSFASPNFNATDPTKLWYWHALVASLMESGDGTSGSISVKYVVNLTYHVMFFRKPPKYSTVEEV